MTPLTLLLVAVVLVALAVIGASLFMAFEQDIDPAQQRIKSFLGTSSAHDQTYGCWKCGEASRCDSPDCPLPTPTKGEE